jgi:hypothetical protein
MAVTALHQKGLDAGDGELLADFTKRIAWTLARMRGRAVVTKQGYGMTARWGLPSVGARDGSDREYPPNLVLRR